MKDWKKILVSPETSIIEVLQVIDASAMQIALVIDKSNRLLGTVTDGDIRRGILKGIPLEKPVGQVMNTDPLVARNHQSRDDILAMIRQRKIHQIPVLDEVGHVVGLEILTDILKSKQRENTVVLMAGGTGHRLRPLTEGCPKPLLKVGEKPILETIINNFREYGFRRFYLAVNYKADMIQNYFGDGSYWGLDINYICEDTRLGTAGALGLLPHKPDKPVIVMNGDLLTKVNFQQLLDFHHEQDAAATMCIREYSIQVPFGVIKLNDCRLEEIEEKPVQNFFVNAGIYVLNPRVLDIIPDNRAYDMTELFKTVIDNNWKAAVFPIREYWIDIGRFDDFEQANGEYKDVFQ